MHACSEHRVSPCPAYTILCVTVFILVQASFRTSKPIHHHRPRRGCSQSHLYRRRFGDRCTRGIRTIYPWLDVGVLPLLVIFRSVCLPHLRSRVEAPLVQCFQFQFPSLSPLLWSDCVECFHEDASPND